MGNFNLQSQNTNYFYLIDFWPKHAKLELNLWNVLLVIP